MIAETAGPSFMKKPCAPRGPHGLPTAWLAVSILRGA
jgi:hypothetical protein